MHHPLILFLSLSISLQDLIVGGKPSAAKAIFLSSSCCSSSKKSSLSNGIAEADAANVPPPFSIFLLACLNV
jgi:hypothetical protein